MTQRSVRVAQVLKQDLCWPLIGYSGHLWRPLIGRWSVTSESANISPPCPCLSRFPPEPDRWDWAGTIVGIWGNVFTPGLSSPVSALSCVIWIFYSNPHSQCHRAANFTIPQMKLQKPVKLFLPLFIVWMPRKLGTSNWDYCLQRRLFNQN